jgi:SAM-dependent methyltransferase
VSDRSSIRRSVRALYEAHPFPQWTREERHRAFAVEPARYRWLGIDLEGARLLEVGCGTGNRTMLAAQRLGVAHFVGFDHSSASLSIARRVAEEEHYDHFSPVRGDLFDLPFPDGSFDVVVSWGVLHHTHDPLAGLGEMVRVCRPGGTIGVFVYNVFNHWRHNIQKRRVERRAGADPERAFEVAHALYGRKPVEAMSISEVIEFYDQYCHPHKSDHTFGEVLAWFDELGLEYQGSCPPLRFGDFVAYHQDRLAGLLDGYPRRRRIRRLAFRLAARLPRPRTSAPPFRRPGWGHRFVWQALQVWYGRHGDYSQGSAFSARKPMRAT